MGCLSIWHRKIKETGTRITLTLAREYGFPQTHLQWACSQIIKQATCAFTILTSKDHIWGCSYKFQQLLQDMAMSLLLPDIKQIQGLTWYHSKWNLELVFGHKNFNICLLSGRWPITIIKVLLLADSIGNASGILTDISMLCFTLQLLYINGRCGKMWCASIKSQF